MNPKMYAECRQSGGQMIRVYIPHGQLQVVVRRDFNEQGEFTATQVAVEFAKDLSDLINEHMNLSKYEKESM